MNLEYLLKTIVFEDNLRGRKERKEVLPIENESKTTMKERRSVSGGVAKVVTTH